MARNDPETPILPGLREPQVRLSGSVNDDMLGSFHAQLAQVPPGEDPVVIELMTLGGDAEVGRRLALEVGIAARRLAPRRLLFVGKTTVFSAGATMMAGFPVKDRFLSPDAVLLVHCRQLQKTLELNGPLRAIEVQARRILAEIENGLRVEEEGFAALVDGSDVPLEELLEKAPTDWYITAEEAVARRLVAGIV